jgi:hypothetical protein
VEAQSGVIAVAGASYSCVALKQDGSLVAWGYAAKPTGTDYVAIAGGCYAKIALKSDGSVDAWHAGDNFTQNPPDNTGFVGICAGNHHWYAIKGVTNP